MYLSGRIGTKMNRIKMSGIGMGKIARIIFTLGLTGVQFWMGQAFAIDQVILTNGRVVEGTVLNDVPNRYVDIRLSTGRTERFQRTEVASVERDVPSSNDRSMKGAESKGWISLLLGGHFNPTQNLGGGTTMDFMFGAKAGFHATNLDFGRLSFALSYDYVSASAAAGFISLNQDFHDLNVQVLMTRLGGSGFYLGPNIGLAMFASSAGFGGAGVSNMSSYFEFGVGAGYEIFVSPSFAIGPELRYESISTVQRDAIKFALQGGFHF
jgi:hypothetical protein